MIHRNSLLLSAGLALLSSPIVTLGSPPLPKDPNNVYGRLDNGFSYILRKNANPPGRVAFFLHVKAGALHETDRQNGLAHFLEHMCFNGSKNFPPGELIPYMNKMGMQFGAHSNAHTTFHETVYKLFMPDTKPETIDTAFKILSDWSAGLLLTTEEIDNERGVILEESRRGKGARERIFDQFREQVFAGSRIAVHDVIGDEEQIAGFPRAEFVDYWNTWYRPENLTLIVVGEIDPPQIAEQARRTFGSITARAASRKSAGAQIKPTTMARGFVFTDTEKVGGDVQVLVVKPPRPPMTTYQDYRYNELENIGTWIVGRRLDDMVNAGTAAFRRAGVSVSPFFNEALMPGASATGEPEDWNKMLDQVVVEISRAVAHGFTPEELTLAKKALLASAERALETESTLDNRRWVGRFSRAVGMDAPILSAQQNLDLMTRVLADVSPGEVHQVFVENFKTKSYNYVLTLPENKAGFTPPSNSDVVAAAAAAWARRTTPPQKEAAATNILAQAPAPGEVVSQSTDPDLRITTARLANGVVVHHRFMDYKKDDVFVSVTMPGGVIQETPENIGVSRVASLANATSRLSSTQIRDLMTGKKVRVNGQIGLDAASFSITGSPQDIETGFQLAHAMITDARIEPSALENWKKQALQRLEMMKTTPNGQLALALDDSWYGNDPRLVTMTAPQIERLSVQAGEQWIKQITAAAPIEIAVVGDLPLEPALELVKTYFGSLPQRSPGYAESLRPLRHVRRGAGPFTKTVHYDSITPKAMALAGFVGADETNLQDHRMLTMAARIISDRMVQRIREKEQLVYSIGARHTPGRALPGFGMMAAGATTDPENANRLADTVLEMFKNFAATGPTAEELGIARKQMANNLETRMKEPSFWLGQIAQMHYRGRSLDDLKQLPDVYQTYSADDLKNVVAKYMKDDRLLRFVIIPEKVADQPALKGQPGRLPAGS